MIYGTDGYCIAKRHTMIFFIALLTFNVGTETIHQNGIKVSRCSALLQTEGGGMKNTRPGTPGCKTHAILY